MFNNLRELIATMPTEQQCREYLAKQRWPDGKPVCPYCKGNKSYNIEDGKRYKCANKACFKKFSVTVGTVIEASNIPLNKWFTAVYLSTAHKKGISSYQLGRDIGVSQKTAWFMLHRVRELMRPKVATKLDNFVEADETYIGGSITNKHLKARKEYAQKEEPKSNKTMALGMIERKGQIKMQVIESAKGALQNAVRNNLEFGAYIITDELNSYKGLNDIFFHYSVNHSKDEFVRLHFHTNSIEGAFSHLKRMIYGIYHQISPQHTHRYLDEFSYRYNSRKAKDYERFTTSLGQAEGRLTYKTLISATPPAKRAKNACKSYRCKPVIKRDGDVVIAEYHSIAQAAKENRISPSNIQKSLRNPACKSGGYFWDFA